jgi:hypothetical protein
VAVALWEKVHPKNGLTSGPKPVAFWEFSLSEKGVCHNNHSLPMTFNSTILRLPMGWRGANTDAMSAEKATHGTTNKFAVGVPAKTFGPAASVNKEIPESVFDREPVMPGRL